MVRATAAGAAAVSSAPPPPPPLAPLLWLARLDLDQSRTSCYEMAELNWGWGGDVQWRDWPRGHRFGWQAGLCSQNTELATTTTQSKQIREQKIHSINPIRERERGREMGGGNRAPKKLNSERVGRAGRLKPSTNNFTEELVDGGGNHVPTS